MEHDQTFRIILIVGFAVAAAWIGEDGWDARLHYEPRMDGMVSVPLPLWLRWVGVGIGVLAGLLLTWTFHTLGKNLADTVVTRKESTLVTTGPYRWVRHPFYLGFALVAVADALATASWFLALTGGLLLVLLRSAPRRRRRNCWSGLATITVATWHGQADSSQDWAGREDVMPITNRPGLSSVAATCEFLLRLTDAAGPTTWGLLPATKTNVGS